MLLHILMVPLSLGMAKSSHSAVAFLVRGNHCQCLEHQNVWPPQLTDLQLHENLHHNIIL